MATWDEVARIASALPGVEEGTSYGRRAWKVDGRVFVWDRPLGVKDRAALGAGAPSGEVLGARVADEGEKFALIEDDPAVFFTIPHFDGYPAVLVRLDVIAVHELEELVSEAWADRAPRRRLAERDGTPPEG